ncbi:ammonium transporter [Rhizobiaceae bacterium BDR2-2]|uniref:Ammonium transporter n=1 Tax=Ectorhizobium quercum TaxID=2965071 RepID=A0AAE3N0W3_9HYPH|nr:ammonium transporter [Ectorhizobium quercum]MCX8997846.1 ammonium transporter [Ectorhizobium quercum]
MATTFLGAVLLLASPGVVLSAEGPGRPDQRLDVAWVLISAALVMMMQVGFMLLEAGMVRSRNSINVAQKNVLDFVFAIVSFAAIGFMFAFGSSWVLPLGLDGRFFFLSDLDGWQATFFVFQVMFCGTAATIVSGAVAERMALTAYVIGTIVLSALIYPFFVHWAWGNALGGNDGVFLGNLGFVDFAGSTVVHATGGWISLAACLIIGPRVGRFDENGRPVRIAGHNPILSMAGGMLLFVGWIGFNGGSTLAVTPDVGRIILNTVLAGAVGTCTGYLIGYWRDGVVLPEKSLCGMLGGLVAVTAGCHVLGGAGAAAIGFVGSAAAVYGNHLLETRFRIDDAVGAVGVHAFAGVVGTLGLAVLAPAELLPAGGTFAQLQVQALGVAVNFVWCFGLGCAFFYLLNRVMKIRVSREAEDIGLNVVEHASRMGVGHVEEAITGLLNGTVGLSQRLPVVAGDEAEKLTGLFNRLMDSIEAEECHKHRLEEMTREIEETERVTALANATFEAILIHRDGWILDCNEQLVKLMGLPVDQIIGSRMSDYLSDESWETVFSAIREDRQGGYEIEIRLPGGRRVAVEARGRDIVYRGEKARVGCLVDLTERKEAERRIRHLAQHDPLTGLPNRGLFNEYLARTADIADSRRSVALILVDLDRFKDINDIHGHPAGDVVIRETARRLSDLIGRQDVAARLGGDEFAVILNNVVFESQLEDFCRRIVAAFGEPFDIGFGQKVSGSVSVGGALCPIHAAEGEDLFACADVALYQAKNSGRNTWFVFRPGMNAEIERRRELEVELKLAIERGEFELHLQPRVDTVAGEVTSYEALLRWPHPERGFIGPAEFIQVAEASGNIVEIGAWVIREACRLLAEELPDHHISINVSPVQFRHPGFIEMLGENVRRSGVRPEQIELEITESVLIDDDRRAQQILKGLKRMGFGIALDDFGTGYSSLSYLSRYPFDTIKLDRRFVANLGVVDSAEVIVRTIIDLGRGLGMKVVAEGVETIDEAVFLVASGCSEIQGFLFGEPQPVGRVQRWCDPLLMADLRGRIVAADADRIALGNLSARGQSESAVLASASWA